LRLQFLGLHLGPRRLEYRVGRMGFPGLFKLEFGQKILDTSESTLGVLGSGTLVPISEGGLSGDRTMGGSEVEGLIVSPFEGSSAKFKTQSHAVCIPFQYV